MFEHIRQLQKGVRSVLDIRPTKTRRKLRKRHSRSLSFDILEDRITPVRLVVTTLLDTDTINAGGTIASETADGAGLSLREAIGLANINGANRGDTDGDFIIFASNLFTPANPTIFLTSELPTITDDLVIDGGQPATDVFINEIHYDDTGADANEGVEIAGPAGTDLAGWSVELYDGADGSVYTTINLTGIIPHQDDGFGTLNFLAAPIQDGAPDGLALVNPSNNVVQFLSYEGQVTATAGAANGTTSVNIGVSESGGTPNDFSLQLGGTGSQYTDFTWQSALAHTRGAVNTNQDFNRTDVPSIKRITISGDDGTIGDQVDNVRIVTINHARTDGDTTIGREDVELQHLIFKDGNTAQSTGDNGGAIQILSDGDVFINDVLMQNNIARQHGGAIYKFNNNTVAGSAGGLGELWITDSQFTNNRAGFVVSGTDIDGGGGAVYMDGGYLRIIEAFASAEFGGNSADFGGAIMSLNGTVQILEGVTIRSGTPGVTRFGGGMLAVGGTRYDPPSNPLSRTGQTGPFSENLIISGVDTNEVLFDDNRADSGGGLYIGDPTNVVTGVVTVSIDEANFINNSALGIANTQGGGAIFINRPLDVDVSNTDFENNQAAFTNNFEGRGGAVFANVASAGGTEVSFTTSSNPASRNSFFDNKAHSGGAIHFEGTNAGAGLSVSNYLLERNDAVVDGGAFHATGFGTVSVSSANVRSNRAGFPSAPINGHDGRGGGFYNSGNVTLTITDGVVGDSPLGGSRGNEAFGDTEMQGGGGVYNDGPNATLNVRGATVQYNRAMQGVAGGGGIFNNQGTVNVFDPPPFTSTTIVQLNEAAQDGGGINSISGNLNIGSVTGPAVITRNEAGRHGGGISNTHRTIITNSTFTLNEADADNNGSGNGGAINNVPLNPGDQGLLTITNTTIGTIPSGTNSAVNGGGVYNGQNADATVNNSSILNNLADDSGGGFFNDNFADAEFTVSTVISNTANGTATERGGDGGGGIYNRGNLFVQYTPIESNSAVTGGGGGVLNADGGLATILEDELDNNLARYGGGFRNIDPTSVMSLGDMDTRNNNATNRGGAGDITGGAVSINDGVAQDNTAVISGGAYANVGGNFILKNTLVVRNTAESDNGGAFYNDVHPVTETGGVTQISNSTITLNRTNGIADGDGGGAIFNNGEMFVADSTVHANFATGTNADGGAVLNTELGSLRFIRGSVSFNQAGRDGGGISNDNGDFFITDTQVINNTAVRNGGGMHLLGVDSTLTLDAGAFRDNTAGESGGGIWTEGTLILDDIVMERNDAMGDNADQGGGAIFNSAGTITMTDGKLEDNDASGDDGSGGGIYNDNGIVDITGTSVAENIAEGRGGALFSNGAAADVTLNNVTIDDNHANGDNSDQGGGGIYNIDGAVTINGGSVTNGTATGNMGSGGGIYNDGGELIVTGTAITDNDASQAGGGIKVDGGTAELTDVTLDDNTAFLTDLDPGDIAIIGFRADDIPADPAGNGNDQAFAWIPLVNLIPNQEIFFTDSGVKTDGTFRGSEGAIKYTAPVNGLDAGTVMLVEFSGNYTFSVATQNLPGTFVGANDANVGTSGFNLSQNGDNIFVFTQTTAAPNFVFGLKLDSQTATFDADSTDEATTALPAALTIGESAFVIEDNSEDGRYNSNNNPDIGNTVGTAGTRAELLTAITNQNNWEGVADLPFQLPDENSDITDGATAYNIFDVPLDGGGGLFADQDSDVTITGGTVNNNESSREGGGLWNHGTATLVVTDVTVSSNTTGITGGGIMQSDVGFGGSLNANTSTVDNNDAFDGGGVYVAGRLVNINTSTLSGNNATNSGGGLHVDDGQANLNSATIANNDATNTGGGIFHTGGDINATSTLVADNTAGANPDVDGTLDGNYNLVENTTGATLQNGPNNITGQDPVLAPLAINGGPTKTHALKRGSPAIDTAIDTTPFGVDQRGEQRPFNASNGAFAPGGDGSDIGAFESQTPALLLVGLQGGNQLVHFTDVAPAGAQGVNIVGLRPGEQAIAIDSRAADHRLYIITDQSRIYRVNATTGQATFVSKMTQGLNDGIAATLDQNRNFFISDTGIWEGSLGAGNKWLKGDDVEGTGNPWHIVTRTGDIYNWTSGGSLGIFVASLGTNVHDNLNLLINAYDGFGSLSGAEQLALQNLDQIHGFYRGSNGDFYPGSNRKWVRGFDNSFGNDWYIIELNTFTNQANVKEWNGTSAATSPFLAGGPYNRVIYDDPSVLYTAFDNVATLPGGQAILAENLDELHDFFYSVNNELVENFLGLNEKWFRGDAAVGNGFDWFYVDTNGDLFRGNGTFIADFDAAVWHNLDLLLKADDPFADELNTTEQNQLAMYDFEYDLARFTQEPQNSPFYGNGTKRWLYGKINSFGNPWYFINTNHDLLQYTGTGSNGAVIANVGLQAFQNPDVLYEAYDRSAVLGTVQLGAGDEAGADFDTTTGQTLGFLTPGDTLALAIDDATDGPNGVFKIDVETGLTEQQFTPPNGAFVPNLAYNNNGAAASLATLYTIDLTDDTLKSVNQTTGALTTIGALGIGSNIINDAGLEIFETDNVEQGYAVVQVDNGGQIESRLYTIDLTTGVASAQGPNNGLIGPLGTFDDINDIALSPAGWDILFGTV